MPTIAYNDRRTAQYVAAAGQTDFECDFAPLKDGQAFVGLYAELIRGAADPVTLTLDDFDVLAPQAASFIARLRNPAVAGDLLTFYGRLPVYRPRQHIPNQGFSSDVAEGDAAWTTGALQELRRDVQTLLTAADLDFGNGGGAGAQTYNDLLNRPPNVDALAGLDGAADTVPYFTGAGQMAVTGLTAFGRSLIAATAAGAIALTSPLAAKGDIYVYGNQNTRLPVGTNGYVLVADNASPLGVKWAAPAAGGGAPDWGDLTNIPAKVSAFAGVAGGANKVAYFTGADAQDTTTLTAFGRSIIGAADAAAVNTLLGGGGGGGGPFPTMASYGAVEDNATDDKPAFDAYMADASAGRAWLHGVSFYNSPTFNTINKPAAGPGRIRNSAGSWAPAEFVWLTAKPTAGSGVDIDYYFSGDISKIEASYYVLGRLIAGGNIRKGINEPYFESVTTPRFEVLTNYSGWSGFSTHTSAASAVGATQVNVESAAGISTGDVIGWANAAGTIVESRTVTVAGNQLTWVGGLANAWPAKTVLTHGPRTHNAYRFTQLNHHGGGDAYCHVARALVGYTAQAGQVHFFETATVGLFGGDIAITADGSYATSEEYNISDTGVDGAAIGYIHSFLRTVDTGARSAVWMGAFLKSEGTKPIDCFIELAGASRVGLDLARADFTSNGNAAIQMALGQRLYFNSSATAGGRGYQHLAYGFGGLYANTPGDMALESGNDGISDYMALRFMGAAGSRDGRIRVRPTSVQVNVNFQSAGTVEATKELVCNSGPNVPALGGTYPSVVFGAGSGCWLFKYGQYLYWTRDNGMNYYTVALVGIHV